MNYELTTCIISVAGLLALWFGPIASLRRDNMRSDIRRIRDELFDFMRAHHYDYSNQSYRNVRQVLNGILRISNNIDPASFIVSLRYYYDPGKKLDINVERDKSLHDALDNALEKATNRLLMFVFLEGSWGVAIKLFLRILLLRRRAQKMRDWVFARTNAFLLDAFDVGAVAQSVGASSQMVGASARRSRYQ